MKTPRILYVEDIAETADAVREELASLPARVDVAENGDRAMNLLIDPSTTYDPYSIIIVDMKVPVDDNKDVLPVDDLGIRLIKRMRNNLYLLERPDTPIIVYTAYEDFRHCLTCAQHGVVDYIPKLDSNNPTMNGVERLLHSCRMLLQSEKKNRAKEDEWLKNNREALRQHFPKGVCIKTASKLVPAGIDVHVIDGFSIVQCKDFNEARLLLATWKDLRWAEVELLKYPFYHYDMS